MDTGFFSAETGKYAWLALTVLPWPLKVHLEKSRCPFVVLISTLPFNPYCILYVLYQKIFLK